MLRKMLLFLLLAPALSWAQEACTPTPATPLYSPQASTIRGYIMQYCPLSGPFASVEEAGRCGEKTSTFNGTAYPKYSVCTQDAPGHWLCNVYRIGPAAGPAIVAQNNPVFPAYGCPDGWTSDGATCRNNEIVANDALWRSYGYTPTRDPQGRLRELQDPEGERVTVESYDTLGRVAEMTRQDGTQERFAYYAETTQVKTYTQVSSVGQSLTTSYEWASPTQPRKIVTPDGTTWTYEYGNESNLPIRVKVKTALGGPSGQPVTTLRPIGSRDVVSARPYPMIAAKGASNQATVALPIIYRLWPLAGAALIQQKLTTLPSSQLLNVVQAIVPMIPIPGALPLGKLAPLAAVCIPDDDEFKPKPIPKPGTPERDKLCDAYEEENQAWCWEHMISDAGMRSCLKQAELENGRCKNGQAEPKFLRPNPR